MADSSSKQRRSETRARIIEAAIGVFAEKGYRAARVADIARAAGVADGTIYIYFRNKESLLLTIFEEKMEDLLVSLDAALEGVEAPLEQIAVFVRFHFEQMREHPALAQVFQVELRQSSTFLRDYRPEQLWRYLAVLEGMIHRGQEVGVVRPGVEPFLVKWAIFGALDEMSIQWVLARRRDRFNLDRATDQVLEIFLKGICQPAAFQPAAFQPAAFEPAGFEPAGFEPAAEGPAGAELTSVPSKPTSPSPCGMEAK